MLLYTTSIITYTYNEYNNSKNTYVLYRVDTRPSTSNRDVIFFFYYSFGGGILIDRVKFYIVKFNRIAAVKMYRYKKWVGDNDKKINTSIVHDKCSIQ